MDEAKKDIGALWVKVSKNGTEYMTGTFRGEEVVGFPNTKATKENRQPNWRFYKSEPRETGTPSDKVPF